MRKNKGVSAVIGVILMVAITVAIAATVYWYVSQFQITPTDAEKTIEYAQHINWTKYDNSTLKLIIDFQSIKDNNNLLHTYRENWYSIPGLMQSSIGPWDDRNVQCYFNMGNNSSHIQ